MPFFHRRNRRYHSETGERTEGDGTAHRGPVLDLHGWLVFHALGNVLLAVL